MHTPLEEIQRTDPRKAPLRVENADRCSLTSLESVVMDLYVRLKQPDHGRAGSCACNKQCTGFSSCD